MAQELPNPFAGLGDVYKNGTKGLSVPKYQLDAETICIKLYAPSNARFFQVHRPLPFTL